MATLIATPPLDFIKDLIWVKWIDGIRIPCKDKEELLSLMEWLGSEGWTMEVEYERVEV